MKRPLIYLACICLAGSALSCRSSGGKPTADEIAEYNYWGSQVSESYRQETLAATDVHTDWAQRKKVQWMTERFRKKAASHAASTTRTSQ